MPITLPRPVTTLPAAKNRGSIYTPLPQDVKDGELRAHAVQTINAPADDLYRFWRRVEFAPQWQEFVVNVTVKSETVSHWVFGDPDDAEGKRIEYDSEIVDDVPGQRIAWRSLDEEIGEVGTVTFEEAPGGRGTRVTLLMSAKVPGGKLGNAVAATWKRSPRQIVTEDLRHFKQLAESGEIPSVVKNSHGPRGFIGSIKQRLYGENNPTPPGTSDLA
jgi:uncharacterized membrane protein